MAFWWLKKMGTFPAQHLPKPERAACKKRANRKIMLDDLVPDPF